MKLAVMQPYFFPYIGYFQCISAVDKYMLYENLDYITEGWMHRNRILVKHRTPTYFSAKIKNKSSNKKIFEIELDSSPIWKKKLLQSLKLNYQGSNYFGEVFPLLENLINRNDKLLFEYNVAIIKGISDFLDISTEIVSDNSNYKVLEKRLTNVVNGDYEAVFPELMLTQPEKKVARVIELCKAEKATCFINAIGGQQLYDKAEFEKYGINLFFIKTKPIEYYMFSDQFHPYLSIIDVLMHNGKEGTKKLLTEYELI